MVFGDGPERGAVERAIDDARACEASSTAPGFVDARRARGARCARALCLVLPSQPRGLRDGRRRGQREGARRRSSSAAADNAAVELVEDGVNGVVADSAAPEDLAEAILRVRAGGRALRGVDLRLVRPATRERLSLERSLRTVVAAYARWDRARS